MTRHILAVASATLLFIVLGYPPAPPSTHYSWGWQRDIRKRSVLESRLYRDKDLIAASNTLVIHYYVRIYLSPGERRHFFSFTFLFYLQKCNSLSHSFYPETIESTPLRSDCKWDSWYNSIYLGGCSVNALRKIDIGASLYGRRP